MVHAKPDGSDPHQHTLLHLPRRTLIADLKTALAMRYPEPGATHIRADDGRCYRHDSAYYGSTLNYMISHTSPQAWWALSKTVRRRRDRAPFVGKRYFISANIRERAQRTPDPPNIIQFPAQTDRDTPTNLTHKVGSLVQKHHSDVTDCLFYFICPATLKKTLNSQNIRRIFCGYSLTLCTGRTIFCQRRGSCHGCCGQGG